MYYSHKQVHNSAFDVWSKSHELSIHAVENSLKIITLTWIFAIEQLDETVDKGVADMLYNLVILKMERKNELQE